MPLDTLCYSCKVPVQIDPGKISTCPNCAATFIAILGFEPICGCDFCFGLKDSAGVLMYGSNILDESRQFLISNGVTFLDPVSDFPAFCDLTVKKLNGLGVCRFSCSWGANYYHLNAWPSASSSEFYLIYQVRRHSSLVPLYHGTTASSARAILEQRELKPPSQTRLKTSGFVTEKDLRFVGVEIGPAEDHDNGAIVDLSYDGWVLVTHLGLSTPPIHKLNNMLPPSIPAIEFWEKGLCIAFRIDAIVTPALNEKNEKLLAELVPPASRVVKACRWARDAVNQARRRAKAYIK